VGGQHHAPADLTPGEDPIPIVQEAGWVPGPVRICAENFASTRIRYSDLPARSDSLYQLTYSGSCLSHYIINIVKILILNYLHSSTKETALKDKGGNKPNNPLSSNDFYQNFRLRKFSKKGSFKQDKYQRRTGLYKK
jgi:hypothetical protein